jgi:hypothetical protein
MMIFTTLNETEEGRGWNVRVLLVRKRSISRGISHAENEQTKVTRDEITISAWGHEKYIVDRWLYKVLYYVCACVVQWRHKIVTYASGVALVVDGQGLNVSAVCRWGLVGRSGMPRRGEQKRYEQKRYIIDRENL